MQLKEFTLIRSVRLKEFTLIRSMQLNEFTFSIETHGRASLRSLNRNYIKAGNHEVDIRADHPIVMGQGSQIKADISAINNHRIDTHDLSVATIGSPIVGHRDQLPLLIPIV